MLFLRQGGYTLRCGRKSRRLYCGRCVLKAFIYGSCFLRLDIHAQIGYSYSMTNQEISDLLNQESYRIWDTTKVIKNQDYHDGLVKGLKMAAKLVSKL